MVNWVWRQTLVDAESNLQHRHTPAPTRITQQGGAPAVHCQLDNQAKMQALKGELGALSAAARDLPRPPGPRLTRAPRPFPGTSAVSKQQAASVACLGAGGDARGTKKHLGGRAHPRAAQHPGRSDNPRAGRNAGANVAPRAVSVPKVGGGLSAGARRGRASARRAAPHAVPPRLTRVMPPGPAPAVRPCLHN